MCRVGSGKQGEEPPTPRTDSVFRRSPPCLGKLASIICLLQDSAFSSVKQDNNITSFIKLSGELNELINVKLSKC